jgi:hypothetical protein
VLLYYTRKNLTPCSRAFFKDFPVGGGAFFEKGPFCEIIGSFRFDYEYDYEYEI